MLFSFDLATAKEDRFYDITASVKEAITKSGVTEGMALVFCEHTTAGITINENADDDVQRDVIFALKTIAPRMKEFLHDEGNSDGHVKTSLVGACEHVIITKGAPLLGRWQSLYFCEFDGPRQRRYHVKVMRG